MDTIEAFFEIHRVFETDGTAIELSKLGATDRERWAYACGYVSDQCDIEYPDQFIDRTWRAYVSLSLI